MTAAPAKSQTIKLQTNIPLVGVVQYCDFAKSRNPDYGDQIKLKGTFDGHGEASVYLPIGVVRDLLGQKMLEAAGEDRWGNPAYKWLYRERVRILKQEDGQKKYTTVTPDPQVCPPVQQSADPADEEPANGEAKATRKRWADLDDVYDACVKIAVKAWKQVPSMDADPRFQALVRSADCLFIEANKRNLPPPPKRENDPNG